MLWEEYYEKIGEWATGTAVSRMSQLTSYGPPEEIIDAILTIGFDDKTGASRLLRKATAAGVKFSGDQLAELYMLCSEEALNHAIHVYREEVSLSDPFSMPARKKTKTTYNAFGKRVGLGAFLCGYGIFYIIAKLVKPYLGNSRK